MKRIVSEFLRVPTGGASNLSSFRTNEDISEVKRDGGLSEEDIENRERWKLG
jgi:hypothetical protein